ncbi:hypothetical protein C8Q80DRAFT_1247167 [Daedaleopsis nitida]|nr:hypothetical protein C8Q80DRAFT_1247167 [Daedaleopsis nitida]
MSSAAIHDQSGLYYLVGFACEAVSWGVHVILFLTSLLLLRRRQVSFQSTITVIVVANCLLFTACTLHFALEFNHFYTALASAGTVNGFSKETVTLFAADIMLSICDLFGDFILLYRCWIVWNRAYWVVVLPGLTAIGGFACFVGVVYITSTIPRGQNPHPAALLSLGSACYTLPLATNVIATALIVGRLWWALRAVESSSGENIYSLGSRTVRHAVGIIVESGVLYLVAQLMLVVLFSLQHPAQNVIAPITVQVYGIAPTLIIMRVALGVSSESTLQPRSVRQTPGSGGWPSTTIMASTGRAAEPEVTVGSLRKDDCSFEMKAYGPSLMNN